MGVNEQQRCAECGSELVFMGYQGHNADDMQDVYDCFLCEARVEVEALIKENEALAIERDQADNEITALKCQKETWLVHTKKERERIDRLKAEVERLQARLDAHMGTEELRRRAAKLDRAVKLRESE